MFILYIYCLVFVLPKQYCRIKKKKKVRTTKTTHAVEKIIRIKYFTAIPFLLTFLSTVITLYVIKMGLSERLTDHQTASTRQVIYLICE